MRTKLGEIKVGYLIAFAVLVIGIHYGSPVIGGLLFLATWWWTEKGGDKFDALMKARAEKRAARQAEERRIEHMVENVLCNLPLEDVEKLPWKTRLNAPQRVEDVWYQKSRQKAIENGSWPPPPMPPTPPASWHKEPPRFKRYVKNRNQR